MLFNSPENIKKVNKYFHSFMAANAKDYFNDNNEQQIFDNIRKNTQPPYDSDWNYLMSLVETIEVKFSSRQIISDANYFSFEFQNDITVQDKGINKFHAIYNCCFRALNQLWKDEQAPDFNLGSEPFDEEDLT